MTYVINIPKPSARRLEKGRRLVVKLFEAFTGGGLVAEYQIPDGLDEFEFEFAGPIYYAEREILDGSYRHEFAVVYQNSTGSRHEERIVEPIEMNQRTT